MCYLIQTSIFSNDFDDEPFTLTDMSVSSDLILLGRKTDVDLILLGRNTAGVVAGSFALGTFDNMLCWELELLIGRFAGRVNDWTGYRNDFSMLLKLR